MRRLLDARVDHVVLLAVAPDRGDADLWPASCSSRRSAAQRFGLAGVLREPDERDARVQASSSESDVANARSRECAGAPSASPVSLRAAIRAASSRTMKRRDVVRVGALARSPRRSRAPWPARWTRAGRRRRGSSARAGPRPRPSRRARSGCAMCRSCWVTVCETRIASASSSIALRHEHAVGHLAAEVVGLERAGSPPGRGGRGSPSG